MRQMRFFDSCVVALLALSGLWTVPVYAAEVADAKETETETAPEAEDENEALVSEADTQDEAPQEEAPDPELRLSKLTVALGHGLGILTDNADQKRYLMAWRRDNVYRLAPWELSTLESGRPYDPLDLALALVPQAAVTYEVVPAVRLRGILDISWAPTLIRTFGEERNNGGERFNYIRLGAGGLAALELPLGTLGKRPLTMDLGAGVLYHKAWFRGHSGEGLGFRVQGSLLIAMLPRVLCELYLAYDHAPATSSRDETFDLNYSMLHAGGLVHFGLLEP